jgi:hypothetical protein
MIGMAWNLRTFSSQQPVHGRQIDRVGDLAWWLMGRKPKVKIPCPHCGALLDGSELMSALGAEYNKQRKTKTGGRKGGRPTVYDHADPNCPCFRCTRKRREKPPDAGTTSENG